MANSLSNRELDMRDLGHTLAMTAIKLYNQNRNKMTVSKTEYVKNYCRMDKAGKDARRLKPDAAAQFWRGVDDALAGFKTLHGTDVRAKVCHKCGVMQCEHLPANMTWEDNSSN